MIINLRIPTMGILLILPLLVACVGPTTPFGSIDTLSLKINEKKEKIATRENKEKVYPRVIFWPKKQVLHDQSQLSVEIVDRIHRPTKDKIKVMYNDNDVTRKFLKNSETYPSENGKGLVVTFKNLRLKSEGVNDIRILYKDNVGKSVVAKYLPPVCSLFNSTEILNTAGFNPPKRYIAMIQSTANDSKYNPNFLAGIVAQESAFNPRAVSWARAIGLTQVTPIAEQEILKDKGFKSWPRYPKINGMSYLKLKTKILAGQISPEQEWRLNPEYSLKGGVTYIKYLTKYWKKPKNLKMVESLRGNKEINLSRVILASYNSGAARVKKIIKVKKDNWLKHELLSEAHNYINRVSSYCYHFSQGAGGDDS